MTVQGEICRNMLPLHMPSDCTLPMAMGMSTATLTIIMMMAKTTTTRITMARMVVPKLLLLLMIMMLVRMIQARLGEDCEAVPR